MSTDNAVLLDKPSRHCAITVEEVKAVLEEVISDQPDRVDPIAEIDLPPRYLAEDRPRCLVAQAMVKLGFSTAVLRSLDKEYATGELVNCGVRLVESQNPALRRLDRNALRLLQWVQDRQDRGRQWREVVASAFRRTRVPGLNRYERQRKPWLYA